jgi:hypothetical protein
MGRESCAMTIIREIVVLKNLKKGMTSDSILSVRELVRKAGTIEWCLGMSIARLTERLLQVSSRYGAYVKNSLDKCSKYLVVSRSRIYLHCTSLSQWRRFWPKPDLPEMRDNVARTLTALSAR